MLSIHSFIIFDGVCRYEEPRMPQPNKIQNLMGLENRQKTYTISIAWLQSSTV